MTGQSPWNLTPEAACIAYAVTQTERWFSAHMVLAPFTPDDPHEELVTLLDAIADQTDFDLVQMIFDQRDLAWNLSDHRDRDPDASEKVRFAQAEFFIDEMNLALERRAVRVMSGSAHGSR